MTNCQDGKFYDINLVFEKADGTLLPATNIKGDLKRVIQGYGKQIYWYYKSDVDEYIGPLKAVVSISSSYDAASLNNDPNNEQNNQPLEYDGNKYSLKAPRIPGGPENAFLSVLLPGFGDHFVNEKDRVTPYFVTAAFLASGYMAYSTMNAANDFFDKYLNTRSQSEMNDFYDKAIQNRNQHQVFFGIASAIWLFDVIHVASKGSKNVRKTSNKTGAVSWIPKYNQFKKSNPFELTLVKTF